MAHEGATIPRLTMPKALVGHEALAAPSKMTRVKAT